ncbi:DUF5117 domain-containing protein [Ruegeria sp. AD91A]|uniref:zinc-dependent metalloprotease n=1 Tax=Ruegeria sp. AD91A TaxID=2293862 RepID=UPI000E4D4D65|nr:zinc-dependent metalloprotease [Ruegeria sp. AD91A]AXT27153.1 DUF5117 domain-containing protein [Ruegeria sp. AD91A]
MRLLAVIAMSLHFLATGALAEDEPDFQSLIEGAEVSEGAATIYAKDGSHYFSVPPSILDRTLFWSAEVARYPADAISLSGTEIATHAVKLERQDSRLLVRSLSSGSVRITDQQGAASSELKIRPIDIAIANAQIGPILLSFEIMAEDEDGNMLVDATGVFSSDIPDFSAKGQIASTGLTPIGVDPKRSYISQASAFPENIFLKSHLTFMAQDQVSQDRAVSIEVAHTIALLPEEPMEKRLFDPRVGYFSTEVLEFENASGAVAQKTQLALRHRLVHADPNAPLPSDPVEPLVYYLSPEIPERWRPYVRTAIEDWQPAFEAAGFTNAIIAKDAPTPQEDPDWSINDARHNVIRWIAQPVANALGPNVHDPRTGEIISAHILVWPEVINVFSDYYFLLMSNLDPLAGSLPLPEELQGRILRYAVSHEVGHTLGLRHNHQASTAWSTEQLRDPAFVAKQGSTASIMAYGRFNYVARPEDGIEQFFPLVSAYDAHAIAWGYTPNLSNEVLDAIAGQSQNSKGLVWGAAEKPDEAYGRFDPTVLSENIGADRLEATRSGVAALRSSITLLPRVTPQSPSRSRDMARVYDQGRARFMGFMDSVTQMVGGFNSTSNDGLPTDFIDVADQKAAVTYLASEAIAELEIFAAPETLTEIRPIGGLEIVDAMAVTIIEDLLDPVVIRRVYTQDTLRPDRGFGVAEMLAATTDAMLVDKVAIEDMTPARRAALLRYVKLLGELPQYAGDPSIELLALLGFPIGFVELAKADLSDTGIADAATVELTRLAETLSPKEDGIATGLFKDIERMIGIDVDGSDTSEEQE